MRDFILRVWYDLGARVGGPMSFRLVMQPLMAMILATRDGIKDAKTNRPPYFYSLFTDPSQRNELLAEGWHAMVRIFILAIILDVIFQVIVFKRIYPYQTVVVAFILAFVPYTLMRGPINRITRHFFIRRSEGEVADPSSHVSQR